MKQIPICIKPIEKPIDFKNQSAFIMEIAKKGLYTEGVLTSSKSRSKTNIQ